MLSLGASYLQHRAFILSLFTMAPQQAYGMLQQKIDSMNEAEMRNFSLTLGSMLGEAQQAAQQVSYGAAWGVSVEDRMAQCMAEAQAGFPSSQGATPAQMYVQGLHTIAYYTNQFYQAKRAHTAQLPHSSANISSA
jgi:hypothetical protein